ESASMAFLGLSLTCARCHNHPLEKWTQDQYYGFASLFARVKIKDGESTGEEVVANAHEGEILHPRRGVAMPPQPLDGPAVDPSETRDRRVVFADWLARKDNPYFARAVINRVWSHFFGRGLGGPVPRRGAPHPAGRRGPARLAGRRLPPPPLRRQAPDPHDHGLGRLCPVEPAGAGE